MDNFNFNLFKYFYYVVLYNGVTNASKNLSVAQPSLSLSIKNLESQLNKILIDRNKKQFSLTEEGYQLYEILKPIFENIEKNIDFFNNDASIDIRTQNFTQRDIINITRERSCVLWKGQIKNMMKNIKKILLSS